MGQDSYEYKTFVAVAVLLAVATIGVQGSHFRGGTISWKPEGGTKVHFYFKLGWRYGAGPGCTAQKIGKHVTGMSNKYWECQSNNCGAHNLHDTTYYCTGADLTENWEQGRNDFEFTFPKTGGPFTVGYADTAWIGLSNGKGNGNWNVATTVDLRRRSDTGGPNSSPESLSKPMYYVPFDCQVHIKVPVIDPDNDKIRCRWAKDDECKTVCNALPHAHLDEETCTVSFNTTLANSYFMKGIYAVALTIEDFPRLPIKMGDKRPTTLSTDDVMSSIPLQFLVQTIEQPCNAGPRFVSPTPEEGEVISVEEGSKVEIGLYADNNNDTSSKANKITASGPIAMILSPVTPEVNRTNTYTATLTWQTSHSDVGGHIVCASVSNDKGMSGTQRCFTIDVVPKGCGSSPCQNDGKCLTNNYVCICRPGFTGRECQDNIDDCASNTCPEGTYCLDGINTYSCPKNTTNTCTCP